MSRNARAAQQATTGRQRRAEKGRKEENWIVFIQLTLSVTSWVRSEKISSVEIVVEAKRSPTVLPFAVLLLETREWMLEDFSSRLATLFLASLLHSSR